MSGGSGSEGKGDIVKAIAQAFAQQLSATTAAQEERVAKMLNEVVKAQNARMVETIANQTQYQSEQAQKLANTIAQVSNTGCSQGASASSNQTGAAPAIYLKPSSGDPPVLPDVSSEKPSGRVLALVRHREDFVLFLKSSYQSGPELAGSKFS